MAQRTKPDWRPAFLEALEQHATVARAARELKIARRTVYTAMEKDEQFKLAVLEAREAGIQELESTLYTAARGERVPVYDAEGKVIGYKFERSITAAIFLLKALRPNVYRDNAHGGGGGGVVSDGPMVFIEAHEAKPPLPGPERRARAQALLARGE